MRLLKPIDEVEQAKKAYRLFCGQPVGTDGLKTLQAVSGQLKEMDDYLKSRRAGKPGDKPRWMKAGGGR